MSEIDNRIRAAIKALDAHGKARGRNVLQGHGDEDVTGLLAGLMHACRRYGTDFDECLRAAQDRFANEKEP
jgi:hypothetical protein